MLITPDYRQGNFIGFVVWESYAPVVPAHTAGYFDNSVGISEVISFHSLMRVQISVCVTTPHQLLGMSAPGIATPHQLLASAPGDVSSRRRHPASAPWSAPGDASSRRHHPASAPRISSSRQLLGSAPRVSSSRQLPASATVNRPIQQPNIT